jgi:hypothetical protein
MASAHAAVPVARPAAASRSAGGALRTVLAWCLLALADAAVGLLGFDRFYRLVRRWPTLGSAAPQRREERVEAACAAVERARTWYFKHAWCLQSAAAAVFYLRLVGVRAELVIAVRRIPFLAHAWAEVDGRPVNNLEPRMDAIYRVIARC